MARERIGASCPSYRTLGNAILADRRGQETWPLLERLEALAECDPKADEELKRIDLLSEVLDYRANENPTRKDSEELAQRLDDSGEELAREGWGMVLAGGKGRERFQLLRCSQRRVGWRVLGLPEMFASPSAAEIAPGSWKNLIDGQVHRVFQELKAGQTFREYSALKAFSKKLSSHPLGPQIDHLALNLDLGRLEAGLVRCIGSKTRSDRLFREAAQRLFPGLAELSLGRIPVSNFACPRALRSLNEGEVYSQFSTISLLGDSALKGEFDRVLTVLGRPSQAHRWADRSLLQRVLSTVSSEASYRRGLTLTATSGSLLLQSLRRAGSSQASTEFECSSAQQFGSGFRVHGIERDYRIATPRV